MRSHQSHGSDLNKSFLSGRSYQNANSMTTDSASPTSGGSTASPLPPGLGRLERPQGPVWEQYQPWLVLLLLGGLGWWGRDYWMPDAWRYPRRATAPAGLSWLPFETTRQQVLERLARNGAAMKCIEPPRMGPMLWASHTNLTLEGLPVKEFALIYLDGGQYNYRALRGAEGPLDAPALATPGSDTAQIAAIRWQPPRGFVEENSGRVPVAVLRELGVPHEEGQDLQKTGKAYFWNWGAVRARYEAFTNHLVLDARPPRTDSEPGAN